MLKYKKNQILVIGGVLLVIAVFIIAMIATAPYALTDSGEKVKHPYNLCVDGKAVALVATEEDGTKLIEDIKTYYSKDDAELLSCKVKEDLTVEKAELKRNGSHPTIDKEKKTLDYLMSGVEEKTSYKVKKGDTGWEIAAKLDVSYKTLEKWNKGKDLDELQIGDELKTYETDPIVHVTTKEKVTYTTKIEYKTKVIKTSKMYDGETKVKKEGKFGKRKVTANITRVNGKVTDRDILSKKTIKEPVTKVVYKGTKPRASSVVSYAMQFLGNPYVYGGSSLTNGTDCSGFTMAVYAHFGYSLPHNSWAQLGSGRAVSYSEAQPGDLIIYGDHVALYAGGGRIIHASNPRTGIITGSATYRHIVGVRRIMN